MSAPALVRFEPRTGREYPGTHYLHPSDLFAPEQPHMITTVLGTCVSVCLWDPCLAIGGMNHFMLPIWNGTGFASPKFGDIAIARLIQKMEDFGSRRGNLIAKIFGGKSGEHELECLNIGARNATVAERMMTEAGITVVARDIGGPFGRKLIFNTGTGGVLLKRHAM